MTALLTAKAKAIDRYIAESPKKQPANNNSGCIPLTAVASIELWPEVDEDEKKNKKKQTSPPKEEDLYEYGDAAPTPRTHNAPRRSSLKGSAYADGADGPNMIHGRRASIGYTGEMTLILPTGEHKKKRSSISFAEDTNVQEVVPVADMVENPRTLWFQASEYQHILEKVEDLVEQAKSDPRGTKQRPSWICTRGLESIISSEYLDERNEANATVLDENRMQKSHKTYDDEYLRNMYRFHTADSQHRALEMGKRDQKEVEEYLSVTRRMCRRMSC